MAALQRKKQAAKQEDIRAQEVAFKMGRLEMTKKGFQEQAQQMREINEGFKQHIWERELEENQEKPQGIAKESAQLEEEQQRAHKRRQGRGVSGPANLAHRAR